MNHSARILRWLIVVGTAWLSTACSVTFDVKPADPTASDFGKTPGFYYALPKTLLNVSVPVTFEKKKGAELAESMMLCIASCGNPSTHFCQVKWDAAKPIDPLLATPQISLITVPDPAHVYYVKPNAGPFRTINHEFTMTGAILQTSNSQGSNDTVKVIAATAAAVAKIVLAAAAGPVSIAAKGTAPAATKTNLCPDIKSPTDLLNPWSLSKCTRALGAVLTQPASPNTILNLACDDVLELDQLIRRTYELEESFSTAATKRVDRWAGATDVEVRKLQIAEDQKVLASLATIRDQLLAAAHLKSSSETRTINFHTASAVEPTLQDQEVKLTLVPDLTGSSDDQQEISSDAKRLGDKFTLQIAGLCQASPAGLAKSACTPMPAGDIAAAEDAGYRYRLPVLSRVSVLYDHQSLTTQTEAIAQFGPIFALPSTFYGTSATLNLAWDPAMGSLTTVKLGQTAVDPTAVLQSTTDLATTLSSIRTARETASAAAQAATASAPTTQQNSANDLAASQLRAQVLALCIAAAQSTTDPSALPDVCKP